MAKTDKELINDIDEVAAEHPEVTGEDDGELTEELVATTTIEGLFDTYIDDVQAMFNDAIDISVEGNPVKTHIEITNLANDVIEFAYELRKQLLYRLAVRAEQFPEQQIASPVVNLSVADQLRKQVVTEEGN